MPHLPVWNEEDVLMDSDAREVDHSRDALLEDNVSLAVCNEGSGE